MWVATTQRKQEKLLDSFGDQELKKSRYLIICLIHKVSNEINIKNSKTLGSDLNCQREGERKKDRKILSHIEGDDKA